MTRQVAYRQWDVQIQDEDLAVFFRSDGIYIAEADPDFRIAAGPPRKVACDQEGKGVYVAQSLKADLYPATDTLKVYRKVDTYRVVVPPTPILTGLAKDRAEAVAQWVASAPKELKLGPANMTKENY